MIKKASTFNFQNTYADNLNGLYKECFADPAPSPKMLLFNYDLAEELELDPFIFSSDYGLSIFSGNEIPEGSTPCSSAAGAATSQSVVVRHSCGLTGG